MSSDRDTYKYQFVGPDRRIKHSGITNDLERRESELRREYGQGDIRQGPPPWLQTPPQMRPPTRLRPMSSTEPVATQWTRLTTSDHRDRSAPAAQAAAGVRPKTLEPRTPSSGTASAVVIGASHRANVMGQWHHGPDQREDSWPLKWRSGG